VLSMYDVVMSEVLEGRRERESTEMKGGVEEGGDVGDGGDGGVGVWCRDRDGCRRDPGRCSRS